MTLFMENDPYSYFAYLNLEQKHQPRTSEQKQPLSSEAIQSMISSINSEDISTIADLIAGSILSNLGPQAYANILRTVHAQKDKLIENDPMELMVKTATLEANQRPPSFFSLEEKIKFYAQAFPTIEKHLKEEFAKPVLFLDMGLMLECSDYLPTGILAAICKESDLKIGMTNVPIKYYINLSIDRQKTNEKSELVFVLTEESNGVVFSKTTFTISELEEARGE